MDKKPFTALTLAQDLQMVPTDKLLAWTPQTAPHAPSATLTDYLHRLRAFDLENTDAAKLLLIDALLVETVPAFPHLKVWKGMALESDLMGGFADYLISPDFAYLKSPLLCVVEAKRDDFMQGRAQCIGEMVACRWNNKQARHEIDVQGIVSNGQTWQFYRLTPSNQLFETGSYPLNNLPELLGVLHSVCAACAANVPQS